MRAERRWRINCNRSFSSARKMRRAVRMMRRTRFGKGGPRHGSSRIGNGTALRTRSHGDRLPGPRFAQGPEAGRTSSAVSQQREKRKELCGAPRTQRKVIHILTPSGVRCEDCCLILPPAPPPSGQPANPAGGRLHLCGTVEARCGKNCGTA